MDTVQQPIIQVMSELIRKTKGTISLGQGVVFYGPPQPALELARHFGKTPSEHKYGAAAGEDSLLALIEAKLASQNGISPAGRRIIVTAGANMAFLNAMLAITDPGDEVILPLPYYFNQEMAIRMVNAIPVCVATDDTYQPCIDSIKSAITPRTRAIVTISPNNPTGAVYSKETITAINELCKINGIFHISDEAYEDFTYGSAQHFSPASIKGSEPHTLSLYSLSKAYGFASWRIGYMSVPEQLYPSLMKAQDTNLICPPRISEVVAAAALQTGSSYCQQHLKTISSVRDVLLEQLSEIPEICQIPTADGAFYILLKVATRLDSQKVAEQLVQGHQIAVIPGNAFGILKGCYLRVAYGALEPETAFEGISRLKNGLIALNNKTCFK